jgi:hypothetical protein
VVVIKKRIAYGYVRTFREESAVIGSVAFRLHFPSQPGDTLSTGRKRIIVGALALVVGLVVGCGGSSDDTTDSGGTPEDAVQAFYDASKAEDAAGVCAALSTESQDIAAAGESCEAAFSAAVKSGQTGVPDNLVVGDATIDGDSATVDVTADGKSSSFTLVNEDGWKLDFTAAAAAGDSTTGVTDSTTG